MSLSTQVYVYYMLHEPLEFLRIGVRVFACVLRLSVVDLSATTTTTTVVVIVAIVTALLSCNEHVSGFIKTDERFRVFFFCTLNLLDGSWTALD